MSAIEMLRPHAERTFLIVGKGPSFDLAAIDRADAVRICINDTANVVAKPDFCIFNDMVSIGKLTLQAMAKVGCFLTPSTISPTRRIDHMLLTWIMMHERLAAMKGKTSHFELNARLHKILEDEPIIHAFNSTYESAIWLLAHAGAKRVRTSGIDFSVSYHPRFGERTSGATPYLAMRYYAAVAIDAFGMDVRPL